MNKSILVAGTNNITGLNIIKSLLVCKENIVYGSDFAELNVANKYCCNFVVPRANESNYIDELLKLVEDNAIRFIIPSNDHDLRILCENIDLLDSKGVTLNGFGLNTLRFLDKYETGLLFRNNDIRTPREFQEFEIELPVVVRKSQMGSGSKYVEYLHSNADLLNFKRCEASDPIFTEYIDGEEFTIDLVCDDNSKAYGIVPRLRKKVVNGMVHFAEIVRDEKIISATRDLALKLNLRGINCVQCIVNSDGCYFIEVNPRPGSGMDLSVNAGINLPQIWIDLISGKEHQMNEPIWGMKMLRHFDGYYFQ
jgi:carbamoyl-phosphate synthase large subunit